MQKITKFTIYNDTAQGEFMKSHPHRLSSVKPNVTISLGVAIGYMLPPVFYLRH